jgi:hypothetical protein
VKVVQTFKPLDCVEQEHGLIARNPLITSAVLCHFLAFLCYSVRLLAVLFMAIWASLCVEHFLQSKIQHLIRFASFPKFCDLDYKVSHRARRYLYQVCLRSLKSSNPRTKLSNSTQR